MISEKEHELFKLYNLDQPGPNPHLMATKALRQNLILVLASIKLQLNYGQSNEH